MRKTMRHFRRSRRCLPIIGLAVLVCLIAGLGSHIGFVYCIEPDGNGKLEFALGGLCVRPEVLQDTHSACSAEDSECADCGDPCTDCTDLNLSGLQILTLPGVNNQHDSIPALFDIPAENLEPASTRFACGAATAPFDVPPDLDPLHLVSSTILII
ncbi:MAG: hypothetical protein GY835_25545 [bacterium]|nr:hypothetical protein [bacterium]